MSGLVGGCRCWERLLVFCFGIFRFHLADKPLPSVFENEIGQKISLEGEIVDEPSIRETNQKLEVAISFPVKTEILLTTDFEQYFKYGDRIKFSGTLKKPVNFITDQGKEFDYINYLKKDGILYVMGYPKIEVVSTGNGSKIKSILFSLKEKFLNKMNFVFP